MITTRRTLIAQLAAGLATAQSRLIIDTHLEVWTLDPKFPFAHPERPNITVPMAAPIENQVEQMKEFGLRYTVLVNPRYYGWDNSYISYSLHKYPNLFVAHGLSIPRIPRSLSACATGSRNTGFRGCASVPSIIRNPHG